MAAITAQKDLVVAFKNGTYLDIGILCKLVPISSELSCLLFKENALEKPTQNLFNHISYYLVGIIDPGASASLPWPLYDTMTERAYRNGLSSFISDYSNKGLLGAVMSSYLVNPGCFKVTKLMFEMSQLAVQKQLCSKMEKESQKKLYHNMTVKYKSQEKDGFLEQIEKETEIILSKFSNYIHKRTALQQIAELLGKKITDMKNKLHSVNAQKYLDDLVDGFFLKHNLDEASKAELMKIKNIDECAPFFNTWLVESDRQIDKLEAKWSEKMSPLLSLAKNTQEQTKLLISRCTGEADKASYMIEYNHKTDFICTKELQTQVNSHQKYILKNIVKDEKLNFPNLIRSFLIAISYVLKNIDIGDEIYSFNEYLDAGRRNYHNIVMEMRVLLQRVMNAEERLQSSPVSYHHSISVEDIPEIPPLPDLSCLRSIRTLICKALVDGLTPYSTTKHQFNLRKRTNFSFAKPQPRSILVTTFSQQPKDNFLNTLISCRASSYDRPNFNVSQFHNISVISRANETIARCSSGFTKEQIQRLLSTKKTSSSKKFKHKTDRPNINLKKGGLFNESNVSQTSNESNGLFRSYSSPNLYENREKRPSSLTGCRKLSIMQEDPSLLEVSGIAALQKDSFNSPQTLAAENAIVRITITPAEKINKMFQEYKIDLNLDDSRDKTETPKTNAHLIKKTSSLEKIINRFKKVRANVLPESTDEFRSIVEEKENMNVDMFTVNRVLLPDLLSPSCSVLKGADEDMDNAVRRKPRESLGTALGVDQTFLDQFDLVD